METVAGLFSLEGEWDLAQINFWSKVFLFLRGRKLLI